MPHRMKFEDFFKNVKPTGAVNRLPSNIGMPVSTYTIYLNGPFTNGLPLKLKEFNFDDLMVNSLTDKLGLDSSSLRDNLKVAELVATRFAWLQIVNIEHQHNLEDNLSHLPDSTLIEYNLLSKGMEHPFIQQELGLQQNITRDLQPVLRAASELIGKQVNDLMPTEVSVGRVLTQNATFTVQETTLGEIVTHQNSRLDAIPRVGNEITVSYYKGTGQVVDLLAKDKVSKPYIDSKTGDLAVDVVNSTGVEQVLLFNSVATFDKFVTAHGLDGKLVEMAIDARSAVIKEAEPTPARTPVGSVYIDKSSLTLAVNYKENGIPSQVLFGSLRVLEQEAASFGLSEQDILRARSLDQAQMRITRPQKYESLMSAQHVAEGKDPILTPENGKVYEGKILDATSFHIVQNLGRGAVIHDKENLTIKPEKGEMAKIGYEKGLGINARIEKEQDKSQSR